MPDLVYILLTGEPECQAQQRRTDEELERDERARHRRKRVRLDTERGTTRLELPQ